MFHAALPFWARVGVDHDRGGFHEVLDLAGEPIVGATRRLRVPCRQIYVYAHAATLGHGPGLDIARSGFAWVRQHAWLGTDRGWARLLTPDGEVVDDTPDLYDAAFVIFALAWLHRAGGDPEALAWAHRTLDFVEAHLRHPTQPGFLHARPATGWRLQNPHMHLLEAALAMFETSRSPRFARLADELADLFAARFFDVRSGTLGELFTEDLARAPVEEGRVVEPGHQFEWAWILARYQALRGRSTAHLVGPLVAFAEGNGVDPSTGLTYDAVRDDGTPLVRGSRTWPNTERIKGHVARFEVDGTDPRGPLADATRVLLDHYLDRRPEGTWTDRFDAAGRATAETVPASTFYHLFLAFAELLRVEPAVRALPVEERAVPVLGGVGA